MLIYLRKFTQNDTKKQIEATQETYYSFFGGDVNNPDGISFKIINKTTGHSSFFKLSKAAGQAHSYRFSSLDGAKSFGSFINDGLPNKYEAEDILRIINDKNEFILDTIKKGNPDYEVFKNLFKAKQDLVFVNETNAIANSLNAASNFKKLLSWFVKQLQINNKLFKGTEIYGQGYKENSSIRQYYESWRVFESFTLDCTLASGFQVNTKANYINKTGTGIDIVPNFDKEPLKLKSVSIEIKNNDEVSDDVAAILNKEYLIDDLSLFDDLEPNEKLKELFDDYVFVINRLSKKDEPSKVPVFDFNQCSELADKGTNLVVYGTPGCGKSYYVEHTLLPSSDYPKKAGGTKERVIRTTFYQDYTNTDFVGQILPFIDGDQVTYKFNPGPFTLALIEAIKNPNKKVALVIEELNRGNAPAIFGDIFQLLDRKDGISEYSIVNVNLIRYLNEVFKNRYSFEFIKLPSNLSIYATMNTSDQNVFTLDTAFKRRWRFLKLSNVFNSDHQYQNKYIPGGNITWKDLVTDINNWFLDNADDYSNEDKQIGVYFVDESGMTSTIVNRDDVNKEEARKFAYKLLEYLWDDAAKFKKKELFREDINSLDQLINDYVNEGEKVFKDGIIKKHEE